MSLQTRMRRLEAALERPSDDSAADGLPPDFWINVYAFQDGSVTLDQLDQRTRELIESLYADSYSQPLEDSIETRIAEAGHLQ